MSRLRRWWPVLASIVVAVVAQQVLLTGRYDVSGHAAEHLTSATAPFFAFAVVVTLLTVTPGARRQPLLLVACLAWFVSTVFVLAGNVHVVDVLVDAGLQHVSTGQLVVEGPIEAAHRLANAAPWYGVLTSLVVVAVLWRFGPVSRRLAIGAGVVSVLFPPWMIPGAGMLVLTVARGLAFRRESVR
ncbi:MAG: hypothetical protein ACRD2W_03950 [Acidimicrobiales bacterium]